MKLRPLTDVSDIVYLDRIRQAIYPYRVQGLLSQQQNFLRTPPRARLLCLLAEDDGEVVGFTRAMLNFHSAETEGIVGVNVLPGYRRRGIGTALLEAGEEHLRSVGATVVRVWGPDDEAFAGFTARHGYTPSREMRYSKVDPQQVPAAPPVPAGIILADLNEAGIERTHAFECAASRDEPGDAATEDDMPLDEWVSLYWNDPDQRLDLGVVALDGDTVVAGTFVAADLDTGRSVSSFTGVLRSHRGRGLAKLVKAVSLRRCAEAGVKTAFTSNDGVNAPMLAVNAWLGYQPAGTERSANKDLT
jgi:GNAT superfamily N-acetyltransferase